MALLWDDEADKKELADTCLDEDEVSQILNITNLDIYLCVFRSTILGVLHWAIAWKAYDCENLEHAGYKVLEVRNPGLNPHEFAHRFSYKSVRSSTVKGWEMRKLGTLDAESRKTLPELAGMWNTEDAAGGNCVTCCIQLIQYAVHGGIFPSEALTAVEEMRETDIRLGWQHIHDESQTGVSAF